MFFIVKFHEENAVDIVPATWVKDWASKTSDCYWPPFTSSHHIVHAVKTQQVPTAEWRRFPCRVIHKSESYDSAVEKIKLAECTSNVETEMDERTGKKKRKRRRNPYYYSSSSDDECHLLAPSVPMFPAVLTGKTIARSVPAEQEQVLNSERCAGSADITATVVCGQDFNQSAGTEALTITGLDETGSNITATVVCGQEFNQPAAKETLAITGLDETGNESISVISHCENLRCGVLSGHWSGDLVRQDVRIPLHQKQNIMSRNARDDQVNITPVEKKVLIYIQEMKQQIHHNGVLLNQVLKCLQPHLTLPTDLKLPTMPMETLEQLRVLEEMLAEEEAKHYMVAKLGAIGGNSILDITRRIIKHLMKPSLSAQFNWCGQRGKKAFKNSIIKDVVFEGVRANSSTRNSKDKDIEESIKRILKHSRVDREQSHSVAPSESSVSEES